MVIKFDGLRAGTRARIRFVDQERGSPLPAWRRMGSPRYLTPRQMAELRLASEIPPAREVRLGEGGVLHLDLPPEGVALIEFGRARR